MTRRSKRMGLWLAAGLLLAQGAARGVEEALFDNDTCLACHADPESPPFIDAEAYTQSVHSANRCTACHADITDVPHPETLAKVDCSRCHKIETEIYLQSNHGQAMNAGVDTAASCRDCHGATHAILSARDPGSPVNRRNLDITCGYCHGDVDRMRQFRLTQAEPIQSYEASVHGLAHGGGSPTLAAVCTDCHGSHDLHRGREPKSKLYWQNIPDTCGKCHENIRDTYKRSVHGRAVAEGNRDAPVCTTCHGEHGIDAVKQLTSKVNTLNIPETCGQCHAAERIVTKYQLANHAVDTYMASFHGLSLQLGSTTAANCASCHGAHDILPSSDPRSSVNKNNLPQTCGRCHPGVSEQVARGQIHSGTRPGLEHFAVSLVRRIYLVLIAVVLGGMFIHNALDFLKKLRTHYRRSQEAGLDIRMHPVDRVQHVTLLLSFIILAITGFALTFPNAWWVRPFTVIHNWRGYIHRAAALIFVVLSVWHFIYMVGTTKGRRHLRNIRPRVRDLLDAVDMFRYYFKRKSHPPKFGHFNYIEKAEYWALVWGSIIMTVTGAFMVWEDWTLRYFPKWFYDVMTAIHYYEAILACAAIVIWHFYFVIFDPDEYPMKVTWLSGRETEADRKHRVPEHKEQ